MVTFCFAPDLSSEYNFVTDISPFCCDTGFYNFVTDITPFCCDNGFYNFVTAAFLNQFLSFVQMERCQEKAHLDDSLQMHMALLCHGITTIMQFLGISRLPLDGVSPTAQFHVPEEIPTLLLQSLQSLQKDLSSGRVPHEMSSLPQVSYAWMTSVTMLILTILKVYNEI